MLLLTPVVVPSRIASAGTRKTRKEEATSARRCQQQPGQRTRSWPSSRFRPPPSHLRRAFSPAASESIRFFPRGYRKHRPLPFSETSRARARASLPFFYLLLLRHTRHLDTCSSTVNVGPHVPRWSRYSATAPCPPTCDNIRRTVPTDGDAPALGAGRRGRRLAPPTASIFFSLVEICYTRPSTTLSPARSTAFTVSLDSVSR